jgi:hypothetical protein
MAQRVDRVDITLLANGTVVVSKYEHRTNEPDRLIRTEIKQPEEQFDVEWATGWLKDHGFTVHAWPAHPAGVSAGARAFRGEPWPIRTRGQILKRRQEIESTVRRWQHKNPDADGPSLLGRDFAFDL